MKKNVKECGMELNEMLKVMEGLTKWVKKIEENKTFWQQRVLENPTDQVCENAFFWYGRLEDMENKLDQVRSELRFLIEDETDEEYKLEW